MVEHLPNKWNETYAATLDQPGLLLYRSNLLGSDHRITNYGGGNTSAKIEQKDPLTGNDTPVLWVKGSGGDVGSMKLDGFATLYMDKLLALEKLYRGVEFEDEMAGFLAHCTFNLNPRATSIDTPLHAYVPFKHVDHMHPDAIIAVAAAKDGQALTHDIFGGDIGWLEWKRPGFELGLRLNRFIIENPDARGVILQSHGLFTWADSARSCYELTLEVINKAMIWLENKAGNAPVFGGQKHPPLAQDLRHAIAARLMPAIRGMISQNIYKAGHFNDSDAVLKFTCSNDMKALAALGTSCPDHFLRTKIRPLWLILILRVRMWMTFWRTFRLKSKTTAKTMPPITSAAKMMTARPCATPTPSFIWWLASECSPLPRTRQPHGFPLSFMSTRSM